MAADNAALVEVVILAVWFIFLLTTRGAQEHEIGWLDSDIEDHP